MLFWLEAWVTTIGAQSTSKRSDPIVTTLAFFCKQIIKSDFLEGREGQTQIRRRYRFYGVGFWLNIPIAFGI